MAKANKNQKLGKGGKRINAARALVKADHLYTLDEAINLIKEFPKAKFDETVDLSVQLGVDPRKAEENVRGTVALPHGTGKNVRVIAICKGEKVKEALDAGADMAGAEEIVEKIQGGFMDFDAVVASPDAMVMIGKVAKILGPRGLMPNPKVGTVTVDVAKAVKAIKAGRVEFRVEKAGIVHVGCGKVSFDSDKVLENIKTVIDAIVKSKPSSSKGIYLQGVNLSTTMGPGIKIDPAPFRM